jgi:hypothetical protein
MRFLYGVILGILASVIGAILYLALAGGEYLLILSPKYQEMKSRLTALEKAESQRDELADRLQDLERRFTDLGQRLTELRGGAPAPGSVAEPPSDAGAHSEPTPGT